MVTIVIGSDKPDQVPLETRRRGQSTEPMARGPVRPHVVVADGDEVAGRMLSRYLEAHGFQVTRVPDGRELLEVLSALPVDVVVLDWSLPDISALEALRRLRALPIGGVPVIITTASNRSDRLGAALREGADDFVTKPLALQALLARIQGRLDRSRRTRSPTFEELGPGTVIAGKYELVEKIDGGGFGVVFRARHLGLETDVAIKLLRASARTAEEVVRLRDEGVAACRVQHPNAVRVHDFGVLDNGVAYLVMELLNGPTLFQILQRTGKLSLAEAARMIVPACNALAHAHGQGLVHRDVKPANVIVHASATGEVVKVIDFGIARFRTPSLPIDDEQREISGTIHFMAPETLRGEAYDGKADVFALGVTLYLALTGALPFDGATVADVIADILSGQEQLPSSLAPNITPSVDRLLRRALDKDPHARPTAAELAVSLRTSLI